MSDLHLWYTRCPTPTPLGLAVKLGFLEPALATAGAGLKSLQSSPDPAVRNSHFTHTQPFSFRQGGNIPPIHARASGRDTRLIGINWIDEFQAVISFADHGLRHIDELAGKRFGVPRQPEGIVDFQRATALKGLHSALQVAGIPRSDVALVDVATATPGFGVVEGQWPAGLRRLPYAAEIQALARNEIDAFFVKGAEGITVARQFDARILANTGDHASPSVRINNGTPRLLTIDGTLARERPDLVQVLLDAVRKAGRWALQHPDETRRFVAQETGVSEEAVAAAFGPELHLKFATVIDAPGLDAVQYFTDYLHEQGFIPASFAVDTWVDV